MGRQSQCNASKRHYEKNKEEKKKNMKERYQKHKEDGCDKTHDRYMQTREGMYKWHYKTVTGYLPYAQGINKEK